MITEQITQNEGKEDHRLHDSSCPIATSSISASTTLQNVDWLLSQITQVTEVEERAKLQVKLLQQYLEAGDEAHQPDTYQEAQQIWLQGIQVAEPFLQEGEVNSEVKQKVLRLYEKAGIHAGSCLKDLDQALELHQRGLSLTAPWQVEHEPDPRVQELVLRLYVNLGVRLGQGGQGPEAIQQYQRGI